MEILIGDKGHVDFDSPIKVTASQKEQIIHFFESIYSVVEPVETDHFRTERLGDKFFIKEWTDGEYAIIFQMENTERVCEMLGRSWMSVDIRRGQFMPVFLEWAKVNNIDLVKCDIKKCIKEFLKEKRDMLNLKKQEKKERRQSVKRIEKKLKSYSEKRKTMQFMIGVGKATEDDLRKLDIGEKELRRKLEELNKNKS